ncbi:SR-related and CTD-associated factor 8 isoform X2 [Anopheles arabiensis]|uniref:SR-related and CTD-associated factor 8 isoform X2 n=1 Tax=Anopheles arabiensis TaxID=7173 RepID=UPI001AAD42E5|nr:SR-related and CTD-associated factor 8 isoform X2 [Anopheles arabiensis]
METVRVFNQELSGLYESKPPISKAKMASITRSAMKAIKFYKHVVQSVEKFIQKCKCEYKIPGLYVIDSIVRQSRHQFGPEKDVFAPRFARNMESTFAHLFRCPPEDKSKIIRVLNLWQKNMVFLPEVIQPLFDLANPDHPIHQQYNAQVLQEQAAGANGMNPGGLPHDSPVGGSMGGGMDDHGGQLQMGETKQLDPSTIRQLQQFQQILMRQTSGDQANAVSKDQVKFNKKLLDFDYGSDDDDDKNSPSVPLPANAGMPDLSQVPAGNIAQILSDPNVLKQLQNLQKLKQQEEKQTKLSEMMLKEEKFEKHLASVLMKLPFANECDLSRQPPIDVNAGHSKDVDTDNDVSITGVEILGDPIPVGGSRGGGIGLGGSGTASGSGNNDRYKSSSSSSRRKSRSRSPRDRRGGGTSGRRGRSHSRSRSASPRSSRRRSSRDRGGTSAKDREREKEHERERKRKGLPEMKKEHLSVCSTTLWVGHLSKLVQQEELSDTFGKYGDIVSIDMIPPRGCAFIVMNRRQDAFKCMQSLKNHKMHGRTITISWAAGKGVKSKEWKDYWDLDLGVSYIPWSKLSPSTDLETLEDGGMFDEDTIPQWMKEKSTAGGTAAAGPSAAAAAAAAAAAMGLGLAPGMGLKKLDGSDLSSAAAAAAAAAAAGMLNPSLFPLSAVDTSQPPPTAMMGMGMPPFPMGPVARLPIPMGIPMGPNMVPGLGINVPPPGMMMPGNPPPLPMGGFGVLPPPPPSSSSSAAPGMMDDMDIEMEDEHTSNPAPMVGGGQGAGAFFNQPPPPLMPPTANLGPQPGPPGNVAGFFGGSAAGPNMPGSGPNMPDNGGMLDGGSDDADGEANMAGGRGARDGFLHGSDEARDNLRGRGGSDRSRDRDQRGGGFERGAGGDGGGRRDRGDRGSRWGGGGNDRGGANNFRGTGGGNNQQDDRPLSERLRELAGVLEFNNQQQRAGGVGVGGGRLFARVGNDGDDFGNRDADFTRRGGNFQQNRFNNNAAGGNGDLAGRNQGRNGPFGNQQQGGRGGMFGNRLGRNNNQQQQRGGQFFNEDRQQQQGGFFDRNEDSNGYDSGGNNNGPNNRRNWNDRAGGRGNNGGNNRDEGNRGRGRQQNWRSGDESAGEGGGSGGGQRFNNARGGGNNNRGNSGGNRPGAAARWDDDNESWDDANNRPTTGRQTQFGASNRQRRNSGGNDEQENDQQEQRREGQSENDDMAICDDQSRHSENDTARDMHNVPLNRHEDDGDAMGDRRFQRNHHRRNDDADDERPQPILYSPEPEEEPDEMGGNDQYAREDNTNYHQGDDNGGQDHPNRGVEATDELMNQCQSQEDSSQFGGATADDRFEEQREQEQAAPSSAMEQGVRDEDNDYSHPEKQQDLPEDDRNETAAASSSSPTMPTPCQEQNNEPSVQSNDTAEEEPASGEPAAC